MIRKDSANLLSMISLFNEVIEKVMFFFAVSSFLISVQPTFTIDSESAAVSLTLPIFSISCTLLWLMVSSYSLAVSAACAWSLITSFSWRSMSPI